MQNWQEYRNFRKTENADGSYTYIITVDGEDVEVSKEVYAAYSSSAYKMEYMERGLKRDRVKRGANGKAVKDENGQPVVLPEREVSLNKLFDEDWDFPTSEPSPEDAVLSFENFESDELRRCLSLLTDDEQALIHALFDKGMTEQEYADLLGIKQPSVNERKQRILKKIKKIWAEPY